MSYQEIINRNPNKRFGKPCIRTPGFNKIQNI